MSITKEIIIGISQGVTKGITIGEDAEEVIQANYFVDDAKQDRFYVDDAKQDALILEV